MKINTFVNFFRDELSSHIETEGIEELPENYIETFVRAHDFYSIFKERHKDLFTENISNILRELETYFQVTQKQSNSVVAKDFEPWVEESENSIDWFYSERLKKFYVYQNVIGNQPLERLWSDTRKILDYCGNPKEDSFKRRGMVIGNVQMGKTTNYSMLICRAADAGYKIIILLSGITNSLRKQTQERIDENFIGRQLVKNQDIIGGELDIMRFGKEKSPSSFTDRIDDFKIQATRNAAAMGRLDNQKNEVIFVAKKNVNTLENIKRFLEETIESERTEKLQYPVMLIDDEADNASVSTAKPENKPTKINSLLRSILNLCKKSTYIGYTATPFANIFIDADSWNDAFKDDLFPHHFITALQYPSNYIGPHRLFAEKDEKNSQIGDLKDVCVREVSDYHDFISLDPPHKKDDFIPELPPSLKKSLRIFFLARAIRIKSGDGSKHSTMMVNVSRFNNIQTRIHGLIDDYVNNLKNHIEGSGLLEESTIIRQLRTDFNDEYNNFGTFDDILPFLPKAINPVEIMTVNGKGGALDYDDIRYKTTGRHLIAVGGLALSRGLTLEGLIVSYVLRNALASDTLLQIGRWFGYRKGYEKLCRVYLPRSSIEYYQDAELQIRELIEEVSTMNALNRTPEDFGLKVLESDLAIRITAANKMRSGKEFVMSSSFSSTHKQAARLLNNEGAKNRNLRLAEDFILSLGSPRSNFNCKFWNDLSGLDVVKFLEAFEFPLTDQKFGPRLKDKRSLISAYISDYITTHLKSWDVVLPHNKNQDNNIEFANISFTPRNRPSGKFLLEDGKKIWQASVRRAISDPKDPEILMSKTELDEVEEMQIRGVSREQACLSNLKKPILFIHIVNENSGNEASLINGVNASVSICFPEVDDVDRSTRKYYMNSVAQKQLELNLANDNDEDEEVLFNANY